MEENSWQQGATLWQFKDVINTNNSLHPFEMKGGNGTHTRCVVGFRDRNHNTTSMDIEGDHDSSCESWDSQHHLDRLR